MGIYYRIVNVTKKEFIDVNKWPDDDNLQKLWLLLYFGHWANCTITTCRDDSDSGPGLGPDAWGEMDNRAGWIDVDDAYEWEEPTPRWLSGRATNSPLEPRPADDTKNGENKNEESV